MEKAQDRYEAIVAAALTEFIANGFAATRIDDIARRAGVAKGTVFHHFTDKEQLFEGVARAVLQPWISHMDMIAIEPGRPARESFERFLLPLVREIPTQRGDMLRLFIGEGLRFPAIAEYYHREILSRVLDIQRRMLTLAAERGELRDPRVADLPQLLGAPLLVGMLWQGLFQRLEPLDFEALVQVQLNCLFVPVTDGRDRE